MNNPFDRLGNPNIGGNFQNSLLQGMELGTQMRERREAKEREAAIDNAYRGVMAGDKTAANALGQVPGMGKAAYELQGSIQSAENDRMEQGRKQMAQMADLLDDSTDEASYQRNLGVARQLGMPVDNVPQTFDPNWIAQQRQIVNVLLREPQKLTTMAQQLVEAGYQPGTQEFTTQMRQLIALEASKVVTTTDGGMAGLYGPQGYQPLVVPNPGGVAAGAPVNSGQLPRVNSPEEAMRLAPGTRFIDPNGIEREVPGGQPGGNRPFDGRFNPRGLQGERVTSTYRTPQRNAEVGGVSNSFHTRRGIDGKPLARDSVPPAGMSMNEYARRLKALNPNYDVINEGDHVHMEPKG